MVGFLNTRLTPGILSSMLSWVVVESLGFGSNFRTSLVECWMRDEMASSHSNIILMSRNALPTLYCFAPFQTRPLGRDLPSILHTCDCKNVEESNLTVEKRWKVRHTISKLKSQPGIDSANPGSTFGRVECNRYNVTIACTRCRNRWALTSEHLPGVLCNVAGLHYVEMPYFRVSHSP